MDISKFCDPKDANWFQQLIGVLNWIVELGRVDIHNSVARLSACLAKPRVGHLKVALHMFSFLKNGEQFMLPLDPEMPEDNPTQDETTTSCWKDFYGDCKEEVLFDMPTPLGGDARMYCFVDADHARDRITRRSYTGIIGLPQHLGPVPFHS